MSIQGRFTFYAIIVLTISFGLFGWAVWALPRNVEREIDEQLQTLLQAILAETTGQDQININALDWPSDLDDFTTKSTFFIVANTENDIVQYSSNLPGEPQPLDTGAMQGSEPVFTTRTVRNQTLRVLTYPIVGVFSDQKSSVIGYIQIGRLINDYTYYNTLTTAALLIGAASLTGSIVGLSLILPYMMRPLIEIIEVSEKITTANDLSVRIPIPPVQDEAGQLVQVLNQLMERIEQLFHMQQRLLADVSHELRTPLTAIRGNVDLIRHMGAADSESLDAIESEAERMTRLVNDLLSLARADVGGLPIRKEPVTLDILFLETYEQVQRVQGDVRVILRDLMPAQMLGDPDRLKQLLLNLMTNAVKYNNPKGKVTVGLTIEEDLQAKIVISDTGIGISAEDLPHIFDRFYRVNKARSRERGGTGLGLAIAKSIVEAHGGRIHADSEIGVGSTFTIFFPLTAGTNEELYV